MIEMELSPTTIGIIGFVVLFLLILLRVQIIFAFGLVGFFGFASLTTFRAAYSTLITTTWSYGTSYVLMAAPLFILMGQFANFSKIGDELYDAAAKWLGRLPGGLAIATIWGSAGFAACTGSSAAGILTFAPIAHPPMKKAGYDKRLILGTLCCGATMGTLIPPSISFIIYGSITDESVGRLFMAGVIPGILEAILYCALIIFLAVSGIWKAPGTFSSSWKEKVVSLKGVWGFLLLMTLVIGGIYTGLFTPTEAAAVGAIGALIILILRKGFKFERVNSAMIECMRTGCMAMSIVIASVVFAQFIALTGLNSLLLNFISDSGFSPITFVILILMLMFILGFVMPVTSIIVLIVPFVHPIVTQVLGFDGIWFGVLVASMAEVAVITPPIGMNLFVTQGLFHKEAVPGEIYQGVVPFVLADIIRIALLIAFPALCLWLPSQM
jgi:tripartite ATP-independent transporter DctM subunit